MKEVSLLLLIINLLHVVETCGGNVSWPLLILFHMQAGSGVLLGKFNVLSKWALLDIYIKNKRHKDYHHSTNQSSNPTQISSSIFL